MATTTLAEHFNQYVETDLLFINKSIVCHYIDRCTRFHTGGVIQNKDEDTLWYAYERLWYHVFGAPENLYTDGESGLVTAAIYWDLAKLYDSTKVSFLAKELLVRLG